tara:strand:+ start:731 stop:952 length:222 start_codon:yes stop_codon:yes gene_type:complete
MSLLLSKEEAKARLVETDWSVLPDVKLTEESKEEYINYRFYLRQVIISGHDYLEMEYPAKPTPVWAEQLPDEE